MTGGSQMVDGNEASHVDKPIVLFSEFYNYVMRAAL